MPLAPLPPPVMIEELTLGLVPPQLQLCCARYDATKRLLSFRLDASFTSSGAQGVVSGSCTLRV